MAGSQRLDIGADQEGAIGHIVVAGFESAQDLGPFGRAAPDCEHPDLISVADLGKDHLEVAKPLDRLGAHCERHLRFGHRERSFHAHAGRSEEHTSELQSLMRISYAVFCLKKKTYNTGSTTQEH